MVRYRTIMLFLALAASATARAGEEARPPADPKEKSVASMKGDEARAMADRIGPQVEAIRGLKFKSQVPVRVASDASTRKHMKARMEKFWPEKQVRAEQRAWQDLGLVPSGIDLVATLLSVLEEQAGGYYDPDADTFFVLDDMPRTIAPILMAHELTHALDDQYFGIDRLVEAAKSDDDRSTALASVVEGSGTAVMTVYMVGEIKAGRLGLDVLQEFQKTEAGKGEKLMATPEILLRALITPYLLGQAFLARGDVATLAQGLKPEDLNRAFKEPPRSSEQILHPEKYWDDSKRDEPRPVPLPDLSRGLGKGWSLSAHGNLGELNLAILAGAIAPDFHTPEGNQPSAWTNAAATGWGGDMW